MRVNFNCGHGEFKGWSKRSPGMPKDPCNQADHFGIVEAQNVRRIGTVTQLRIEDYSLDAEVVNYNCPIDIGMGARVAYTNSMIASGTPAIHVPLHHNAKGRGEKWYDTNGFRALYFPGSKASKRAAEAMVECMQQHTHFRDYKVVASVWTKRLYELLRTKGPAVIQEAGFQTNREDVEYIKSIQGISDIANGNAAFCREVASW